MSEINPGKDDIVEASGSYARMIPVQHVMDTGEVPISDDSFLGAGGLVYPNYTIALGTEDAYTMALDEAIDNVMARVEENPVLQGLLDKPEWSEADRYLWERELTEEMSEALGEVCNGNLAKYRNEWLQDGVDRPSSINALSTDLENDTQTIENDCDTMAITQAIIIQMVEDLQPLLPEESPDGDSKCKGTYYICYGKTSGISGAKDGGRHAQVMSSETGAIIEPTTIEYAIPLNQDPIGDFTKGLPVVTEDACYDSNDSKLIKGDISFDIAQQKKWLDSLNGEMNTTYDNFNPNSLENSLKTLVELAEAMEQDPRIEMLAELYDLAEDPGIDRDTLKMMQDILKDPEVSEILSEMNSNYDFARGDLYSRFHSGATGLDAIADAQIAGNDFLSKRPEILDKLPSPDAIRRIEGMYISPEGIRKFEIESMDEDHGERMQSSLDSIENLYGPVAETLAVNSSPAVTAGVTPS